MCRALRGVAGELATASPLEELEPAESFLEAGHDGYWVNGDSIEAPGGRYPSARAQERLEARLAELDGVCAAEVVCVGGGIASALELALRAYQLQGHEAIVIGLPYAGAANIMLLMGMRQRFLQPAQVVEHVTLLRAARCVFLTHPSFCVGADLSECAWWLARELPSSCVLIVDECYAHYQPRGGPRSEALRARAVVVGLRSLSKLHGLAALRLAYAVARGPAASRRRTAALVKQLCAPAVEQALRSLRNLDIDAARRTAATRNARLVRRLRPALDHSASRGQPGHLERVVNGGDSRGALGVAAVRMGMASEARVEE